MIGEELPQLPGWLGLSPYALIVALVIFYTLQLSREKLFTRGQHLSIVEPLKETISKQDETIAELLAQNSALLAGGEITSSFFRKVPVNPTHGSSVERTPPRTPKRGHNGVKEESK